MAFLAPYSRGVPVWTGCRDARRGAAGCWFGRSGRRAQMQEAASLDRIIHPGPHVALQPGGQIICDVVQRRRVGRPTVRAVCLQPRGDASAGDGAFQHAQRLTIRDSFRTRDFATHSAAVAGHGFAQTDQDVRHEELSMFRRTAPPINRRPSAATCPPRSRFSVRGKRQDTIDDLRKQKNLTIDQVREILNKNR